MSELQNSKALIQQFYTEFDRALCHETEKEYVGVLEHYTTPDYEWRGMHPFYEQSGCQNVIDVFWTPFRESFKAVQRRQDIFLAGANDVDTRDVNTRDVSTGDVDTRDSDSAESHWVCSMGHLVGLFDKDWLGIPATGKMTHLRYAEFNRVANGKITETALFCDIISVMQQAGLHPLPEQTGASFIHPGPRTHDGILMSTQAESESIKTMDLVDRMVKDLIELNLSGNDNCPPELLARTWHDDMTWYGPAGIGATYTIDRYQQQHQYPFREGLKDKVFNGHIARFAEGNYACFFGWANLTNAARGGFLGMTGNDTRADMRVVDVYRREGEKLAENWVFIDLLHYLSMQGLDVLSRMKHMRQF